MFEGSIGSISSQLKKAKEQKDKAKKQNFEPEYEEVKPLKKRAAAPTPKSEERKVEIKPNPSPEDITEEVVREESRPRTYKEERYQAAPSKRKEYPERTFDKFVQKGARLRPEDIDIMKAFCAEISHAKRQLPENQRPIKRLTDNTIIRLLVTQFCEKVEGDLGNIDFSRIQTEEELNRYISKVMGF